MKQIDKRSSCGKLLFLGDVMPCNPLIPTIRHNIPFVLNLETPILEHGKPIPGKINLKAPRNHLEALFDPLPVAVSLANNHALDYGNEGFEQTRQVLKELDIGYFGAGTVEDNFNNPFIMKINGFQIALLGYCYDHYYDQIADVKGLKYGPAALVPERVIADINQQRDNVDYIVVQLHWGKLYSNYPTKKDVCIARSLIENGADIIVGHHSHTVQPIERYQSKIIAYGLGNYLFPDLDLPSHYDNSGVAKRKKTQKQRLWNRSSAGIVFDLETAEYNILHFTHQNDQIYEKKTYFHKYLYSRIPDNLDELPSLIEKNLLTKKRIQLLLEFIERPRIPSRFKPKKTVEKSNINVG